MTKEKPLSEKRQFIENSSEEWYSGYNVKEAVEKLKEEMYKDFVKMIGHESFSLDIMIKKRIDKIFGNFGEETRE